ncbi:MAG TPA: metal-sensing transcriptional repressor [Azospirillaceae bacterium]|nr:metal-sensing transcriptional repressor [Azospirillaceae bacterium]
MSHATNTDIIKRLKRAHGHLASTIAMIEEGRDCIAVVQQMHAVIKALENAKSVLIVDHLDHCVERALGPLSRESRAVIDEFKEITKYL